MKIPQEPYSPSCERDPSGADRTRGLPAKIWELLRRNDTYAQLLDSAFHRYEKEGNDSFKPIEVPSDEYLKSLFRVGIHWSSSDGNPQCNARKIYTRNGIADEWIHEPEYEFYFYAESRSDLSTTMIPRVTRFMPWRDTPEGFRHAFSEAVLTKSKIRLRHLEKIPTIDPATIILNYLKNSKEYMKRKEVSPPETCENQMDQFYDFSSFSAPEESDDEYPDLDDFSLEISNLIYENEHRDIVYNEVIGPITSLSNYEHDLDKQMVRSELGHLLTREELDAVYEEFDSDVFRRSRSRQIIIHEMNSESFWIQVSNFGVQGISDKDKKRLTNLFSKELTKLNSAKRKNLESAFGTDADWKMFVLVEWVRRVYAINNYEPSEVDSKLLGCVLYDAIYLDNSADYDGDIGSQIEDIRRDREGWKATYSDIIHRNKHRVDQAVKKISKLINGVYPYFISC